jgi:hypothetical protein
VEDEVVMLAVLLPEEWWVADEATAAVPEVAEDIMLEVMLMESVSLAVMELSVEVEAAEDADELGLGAALLSLSITKGGV